eukprot:s3069_g4.t1
MDLLTSLRQTARCGSFPPTSCPTQPGASLSLQCYMSLDLLMFALKVMSLGLLLSASGFGGFGFPPFLRSFGQTGFTTLVLEGTNLESCISMRSAACLGTPMLASGVAGSGNLDSLLVIDDAQTDLPLLVRSSSQLGSPLSVSACAQAGLSLPMRSSGKLGAPLFSSTASIGLLLPCLEHVHANSSSLLQRIGHFDSLLLLGSFECPGLFLLLHAFQSFGSLLLAMSLSGKAFPILDVVTLGTSVSLKDLSRLSFFSPVFDHSKPGVSTLLQQFAHIDASMLSIYLMRLDCGVLLVDLIRLEVLTSLRRPSHLELLLLLCKANQLGVLLLARSLQRLDSFVFIARMLHAEVLPLLRSPKGLESFLSTFGASRPGLVSSPFVSEFSLADLPMSARHSSWLGLALVTAVFSHLGLLIFLHGSGQVEILILPLACLRPGILLPVLSAVGSALLLQSLVWPGSFLPLGSVGQSGSSSFSFSSAQLGLLLPLRSMIYLDFSLLAFCMSPGAVRSLPAISSEHLEFSVLLQSSSRPGAILSAIISTSSGPLLSLQSSACVELVILLSGASNTGKCNVYRVSVLDPSQADSSLPVRSSCQTGMSLPAVFMSLVGVLPSSHAKTILELLLLLLGKT